MAVIFEADQTFFAADFGRGALRRNPEGRPEGFFVAV